MTLEVLSGLLSCFSKASPCLVLAVPAFSAVSSVPECLSPYRPGAASGLVSSGKCRGQYQQRPVCFPVCNHHPNTGPGIWGYSLALITSNSLPALDSQLAPSGCV